MLRRDPLGISRIWVLDPDGIAYAGVPYRKLSRPPISVWEQKAAVRRLRELGRAEVDENTLFSIVAQMWEIATQPWPPPSRFAATGSAALKFLRGRGRRRPSRRCRT
ncbi:hypothetical protein [Streptomyces sp. NBC_01431]|uniref:hypothetical protein n=1 Tax=Streptomyces sp. NBC_01431 TaxID=2903863 RepID=UPI002E2EE8A8|nr:hypothetical protein [Streptomyces sp. NBC_01431]